MASIVLGFADRYQHLPLEEGLEEALGQAEAASRAYHGVTDVWLFGCHSEAPWHASVALPPKGNRRPR